MQLGHLPHRGDRDGHVYRGYVLLHLRVCEGDCAPYCENERGCVSDPLLRESIFRSGRGLTRHHDCGHHLHDVQR